MHVPVLLHEAIEGLSLKEGDIVIDGTLGLGGHSKEICEAIGKKGTLLALDLDQDAIEKAKKYLTDVTATLIIEEGSFADMYEFAKQHELKKVNGILLDLGWNSTQLESGRGFSFMADDPLLMTFKKYPNEKEVTAHTIVNEWSEQDIADILVELGEEKHAGRIAHGIVCRRRIAPIDSAVDLAEVVSSSVPGWYRHGRTNPATKTFQALRIVVNNELSTLETGIRDGLVLLKDGGRLAIITFHSIEDRIVKKTFKEMEKKGRGIVITKKAIKPSREELLLNSRARSAKLRIFEKHDTN